MSKSSWAVIILLLAVGIGTAVWADKGSWLNAVATGACNACPAPPACKGDYRWRSAGRSRRGALPSVDGCGPSWWKRPANGSSGHFRSG